MFVRVLSGREHSCRRARPRRVYLFSELLPKRIVSHVILAALRRLDMQATQQQQQILPNESAELTTPSSEHSRDGKAVEHRGGSTPEGQAQKSLPFSTSNDGSYGEVHFNVSDAYPDAQDCLLNVSVVDVL
jgi:hypothetical protein